MNLHDIKVKEGFSRAITDRFYAVYGILISSKNEKGYLTSYKNCELDIVITLSKTHENVFLNLEVMKDGVAIPMYDIKTNKQIFAASPYDVLCFVREDGVCSTDELQTIAECDDASKVLGDKMKKDIRPTKEEWDTYKKLFVKVQKFERHFRSVTILTA